MPGSGCDHRCRHRRSCPNRVRDGWVESFHPPVVGGCRRIADGSGRGVADVRAHGYTRVIPDASEFADTQPFRGR